jgi:RNA polymerase sigma-70 factor (ECF subfamily)
MFRSMEAREGQGLAQAIRRVGGRVYGVANGDTEDVVQEAVVRAIKSGVSLEAEQWLTTVAKRVAIDQHRRRRETPSGAPTDLERWIPSTEGNPEETVIREERSRAVHEALDALPPRYRKVLLAYAEEDSPSAVARRLGLSATATWTLLSRARSRLRLQLEQGGFVPALVSMTRARWRGFAAAGAVAGVAATAALVPIHPKAAPDHIKPEPKVVSLAAPAATAPAPKPSALTPDLPVATTDVTKRINDAVNDVKEAPASVKVTTCLGRLSALLPDLEIELAETNTKKPSLVGALIKALPEPLREVGAKTCA